MFIIEPKLSVILEGFQVFTHEMEDSTIQFCRSFGFQEFFYVFFFFFNVKAHDVMMSLRLMDCDLDRLVRGRGVALEENQCRDFCSKVQRPIGGSRPFKSLSWSGKGNFHSENDDDDDDDDDDDKQQGSKLETTPCLVSRLLLLQVCLETRETLIPKQCFLAEIKLLIFWVPSFWKYI